MAFAWGGLRRAIPVVAAALVLPAHDAGACDPDTTSLFGCNAAHNRKFIELCAPSPLDAKDGFMFYRFGTLNRDGSDGAIEFEFPARRAGSLARFFAAAYTDHGVYTQSVRFVSGDYSYRLFTESGGKQEDAGVDVCNLKTGATTRISCSERPRFYIFDLKDIVPCDPDTPLGRACLTDPLRKR